MEQERPLHGDVSSVNQALNMTTTMSGNSFNTSSDVDYSMVRTLSYLGAGLND
jgi:hypothetical protein